MRRPVCGFIGLGSQGAPIARRMIDAGYPVVLWARRDAALEPFRASPAIIADTIEALAGQAEHVGLCVLDDGPVLEVCDRLIPAMRPGSRLVVHSTTHPDTCRKVQAQASTHGVLFVEAPVSGGAPAAQIGMLTVMTAGDRGVVESARPIFETFARLIVHLGDVGSAQTAKLINNTIMAANLGIAHSAIAAGVGLGLDRETLAELLKQSSGRSYALEVYSRLPDGSAFAPMPALLDKVHLLGQLVGEGDPTFRALHDAAMAFAAEGSQHRRGRATIRRI